MSPGLRSACTSLSRPFRKRSKKTSCELCRRKNGSILRIEGSGTVGGSAKRVNRTANTVCLKGSVHHHPSEGGLRHEEPAPSISLSAAALPCLVLQSGLQRVENRLSESR